MRTRRSRIFISLVFIIFVAAFGVYMPNRDYISGLASGSPAGSSVLPVTNHRIDTANFIRDRDAHISQTDPQIIVNGINAYVEYVDIDIVTDETSVTVYYTDPAGVAGRFLDMFAARPSGRFDEERSFSAPWNYHNGVLRVRIDKTVRSLRFDIGDNAGARYILGDITVYPAFFVFIPITVCMTAGIAFLLSLLFYIPISAWRGLPSHLKSARRYGFLLQSLVKRDITVKYRRSVLGVLWSVLNPLLTMLVLTAVFQRLFRFDIENFPLYLLTGTTLFNFMSEATTGSMASVTGAAGLIKKVYIPKYIFPLEKCLFALVNAFFSMIAVLFLFLILRVVPPATFFLFPLPMLLTFLFSIGLGFILSALNVFFRDTSHLYGVFITAWMYLTPIIYPADILSSRILYYVELNPMYYYVDYFRQVTLYGTLPDFRTNMICIFFSLFFLLFGLFVFKKRQDFFILYI